MPPSNAAAASSKVNRTISFVIVTWNAKEYVTECLQSIRENCSVPAEIIVVDNASHDGTPGWVSERFPECHLVETGTNLGFARGNNVGITLATGEYLFLVNSDVKILPRCVENLIELMEANPDVALAGPQMLGPDGSIGRSTMRFPTLWSSLCRALALDSVFPRSRSFAGLLMGDFDHRRSRDIEVLNGWFWVVRRQALGQVGALDEQFFMYGEDMDWCYRFHKAGWRNTFCAESAAVHYGGASSALSPARFYVEQQRGKLQYWKKHHGRFATFAYLHTALFYEALRAAGYAVAYLFWSSIRGKAAARIRRSLLCMACLAKLRAV
ncbi:MAG TPA: glycosyltransferase family 2 protein [Candidatus Acidoferrales bacterium]|nr:glycosyltransferase family 2 protein [Candidatus Acidoferrales bacterium]